MRTYSHNYKEQSQKHRRLSGVDPQIRIPKYLSLIHICDNISGQETFERECSPLLQIRDAYPKMIIARTKDVYKRQYQVKSASDGALALEILDKEYIDLIISCLLYTSRCV